MRPLRILLTNNTLATRAGSELYIRDLALALVARGHRPVAYSTVLGAVANDLRKRTVPVIDDLRALSARPDVIHGQHHLETMTALLHFPGTPAISVCHGWAPWEEAPPTFPRIRRYVVVDDTCLDRVVCEHGIDPASVLEFLNAVDLDRFRPRPPLPATPARALVINNAVTEANVLPAIRAACARYGLSLDVVGLAAGTPVDRPEDVIGDYDIVFAKARAALEAMAVGAAVVLCSPDGLGTLVTSAEVARLRRVNFGVRALNRRMTADAIAAEIARYQPDDAAAVSTWIRSEAGFDRSVDEWIRLYDEVIDAHDRCGPRDADAESRAAAAYVRSLSSHLKSHWDAVRALAELRHAHSATVAALAALRPELEAFRSKLTAASDSSVAPREQKRIWALGRVRRAVRRLAGRARAPAK